ncbi:porin [Candidatus Palauibacter sp.]|uniref:porin n=1 Tax=Candidatus Palauibacter sp. TaxID=3101350 RepID=UPI003B528B64
MSIPFSGVAAVVGLGLALVIAGPLNAQEIGARGGSSVTIGARIQAQFEASSVDDTPSSFFIRRAWVTMDGRLNDLVAARAQYDIDGSTVLEAYLELTASEALQVQLGQFKKGISEFWLVPNAWLPIIERDARVTGVDHCPGVGSVCSFGRLTGALGLDNYEPGILAQGRFGERFGYRFTLTNGEGIGYRDVNRGKSASGRFSVFPAAGSRVSAYLALDETLDSHGETMGLPAYGAEVEIGTWLDGPHLMVNALRGRNWKLDDDAKFSALQLMAFWYFPLAPESHFAAVEPMVRVSWVDSGAEDPDKVTGTVVTPGVMVYFVGRNGISTNVDFYTSGDHSDWSLKVQAFAFF